MVATRAKFRILSILRELESVTIRMRPVMPRTKTWPQEENSAENAAFWDATPSGLVELTYLPDPAGGFDAVHGYTIGAYVYVDIAEAADSDWTCTIVSHSATQLDAHLQKGWSKDLLRQGRVELSIQNAAAWPTFEGKAGQRFAVTFSPAPAGGHAY